MNHISGMESAAQDMALDLLINPQSVEQAFVQHIFLLVNKRQKNEITFKDLASFLAICSFTTKMAIEKSEAQPSNMH